MKPILGIILLFFSLNTNAAQLSCGDVAGVHSASIFNLWNELMGGPFDLRNLKTVSPVSKMVFLNRIAEKYGLTPHFDLSELKTEGDAAKGTLRVLSGEVIAINPAFLQEPATPKLIRLDSENEMIPFFLFSEVLRINRVLQAEQQITIRSTPVGESKTHWPFRPFETGEAWNAPNTRNDDLIGSHNVPAKQGA